jgi:hypothetical protein
MKHLASLHCQTACLEVGESVTKVKTCPEFLGIAVLAPPSKDSYVSSQTNLSCSILLDFLRNRVTFFDAMGICKCNQSISVVVILPQRHGTAASQQHIVAAESLGVHPGIHLIRKQCVASIMLDVLYH